MHFHRQAVQFFDTNFHAPGHRRTPTARVSNDAGVGKNSKKTSILDQQIVISRKR